MRRGAALAQPVDLGVALAALKHRGPDASGTYRGRTGEWECQLAHTRLAIIDLSPLGEQPMASSDGRYHIAYNGEVYNFASIRKKLEAKGVTFRSHSDTEVILAGYALWGPQVLSEMRGMFALAIWDTVLGTMFLARDRLGIKPLYICRRGRDFLAFASELRALMRTGCSARRLSPQGVLSYLTWGSVAGPGTILDDVELLPPGCYAVAHDGEFEVQRYWSLRPQPIRELSFDEAVERVRPVLAEAVKLRLIADVPVGVFLSGGIDSSVIASLAKASHGKVSTFSVVFESQALNEGGWAQKSAEALGTEHRQLLLSEERAMRDLSMAAAALDQPSADGVNTYFVSEAVRREGIPVALSGLGGDELFGGYAYFRQFPNALRLSGVARRVPNVLRRLANRRAVTHAQRAKALQLLTGRRGVRGAYLALRCLFTEAQVEGLVSPEVAARASAPYVDVPPGVEEAFGAGTIDEVGVFSALDLSNYLKNTLLRDADAMSMAHALEVRVPLIDHVLVETVLPLTAAVKLRPGVNKPLLVSAAPRLPIAITARPKMGFVLPYDDWFRGKLRPMVEGLLLESIRETRCLDAAGVRALWESFLARRVNAARVWCVAALVAWCIQNEVGL